ncbi:hypothetical protein KIW84_076724 [Lathyrus oleraceus]|uniref:Retrotransposon gag domain-containing protein n=1 Tax=Pisum sativum TaxID=3888 RepID=A0A9D5A3V9_PEA|nr:hypothetical protein KIW84_076724 [Pisum sativum]
MTMSLRSKAKIHFINGSLPRPHDEDHNSLQWDCYNTMIMSWINNSVEIEIAQSIMWMDSAAEMWRELKDHFIMGTFSKFLIFMKKFVPPSKQERKATTAPDESKDITFSKQNHTAQP